jgi:hypothetical protein
MVDTRWRYFSPADVYSYKKDDYATKSTLPESEDPDIIVEKQEQIIGDFNGDGKQELMGVNTGTHDSGDDQGVNVPDGSFVFSDTKELTIDQPYGMMSSGTDAEEYKKGGKVKGTKKRVREQLLYGYKDFGATGPATPAQLAKKYDLQKMSAIIDDPKKDNLAKKTANLMYENYMNKLTQLADTQEAMKAAKKAKEQRAQMEMGGFAPEMQGGGKSPSGATIGDAFRFDLPAYKQQEYNLQNDPMAIAIANSIYGAPKTGTYVDNMYGPRTEMVGQMSNSGKRKVMVTPPQSQNIYGFRFDQDPNQTPVPDVPGLYLPGWRFDKYSNQVPALPQPVQSSKPLPEPEGSTPATMDESNTSEERGSLFQRGLEKLKGFKGINPDLLGDLALAAKAATIKKYKPWEPPVVSVMPQASYLSPERELAYNSEMAAMAGLIGNQIGNTRTAAAIGRGAQGQALTNAANILGKTYNANVGIKNQFETLANNLTNETLEKQRERAGRLNYDTFMANQMYRNQINDALDATVKRAYEKENEARNRAVANLNNKYWHYDKRNFPVWNFEGAREKYLKELEDAEKGTGLASGTTVDALTNQYIASGINPEKARIAAENRILKSYGVPVVEEKTTTDETGKTKTTKTVKKKQGGFSPKSISKFLAHSLG